METWSKLAAALVSIDIDVEIIDEARKKVLEKGAAFSIPNVFLNDEQQGRLGLKRD
jgi:glutaredoxin